MLLSFINQCYFVHFKCDLSFCFVFDKYFYLIFIKICRAKSPQIMLCSQSMCFSPLYTNEFFHLVGYIELGVIHCTYFDLILYVPVNNLTVISGWVFLD